MAKGLRKPGEFCWTNMLTPEPAEAREFFGRVLGWTYFEMPGLGHGARVDGHDVGGIFDLHGPRTPPGLKPHIGGLIKVEDADALVAKVESLGGRAKPAFDVGDQGRLAVCTDPNGAEFDVWEPKSFHGTDVDPTVPGAPSWFEALTTDVDRAARFYAELFGWSAEVSPMPGFDYTILKLGPDPIAGMIAITPEMVGLTPHWATYYTVVDAEKAASEAVKLGARVHVPTRDIPAVGRFAGITSPQGVAFYAIEYDHLKKR